MPTQFTVKLDNKPGQIGKLATALGDRGVNIRTLVSDVRGRTGIVHFLVNDEEKARQALRDARFKFTEREAVVATIEDRPGTLGWLGKNLGAARVNIEQLLPIPPEGATVQVALTVDKPDKARTILQAR